MNSKRLRQIEIFLYCLLLTGLGFIFFYKLGAAALESYDEAWYATIARNIVITGNPFKLIFNSAVFTDHPPMGFWLMAITTAFFGSNEFSNRSVSAFLGLGSIILVFLIGKSIKNKLVGVSAAAILLSCLWFMVRARSANLDVPFVFFELLTLYGVVQIRKNFRYLYVITLSFSALFLTKTLVGVGMLPVIAYTLWLNRKQLKLVLLLKNFGIFIAVVFPWYLYNAFLNNRFLYHHFLEIGFRKDSNEYNLDTLSANLQYLQIGVGKWYKIFWSTLLFSPFLLWLRKKNLNTLLMLFLTFFGFAIPFLLSKKTEVWHLIPLYPPLALLAAYVIHEGIEVLFPKKRLFALAATLCFVMLGVYQLSQFSNLLYPVGQPFSAEKDISLHAAQYPEVRLMGPFFPAAVYYSNTYINSYHLSSQAYEDMVKALISEEKVIFIINQDLKNDLDRDGIPVKVLYENAVYKIISNAVDSDLKEE